LKKVWYQRSRGLRKELKRERGKKDECLNVEILERESWLVDRKRKRQNWKRVCS